MSLDHRDDRPSAEIMIRMRVRRILPEILADRMSKMHSPVADVYLSTQKR